MTQTGEMTHVVSVGARRQRRPVIEQVARELCHPVDGIEQVEGHRIVELLETTPLAPVQPDPDAPEDATSSSAVPVSKVAAPLSITCLSSAALHFALLNWLALLLKAALWLKTSRYLLELRLLKV